MLLFQCTRVFVFTNTAFSTFIWEGVVCIFFSTLVRDERGDRTGRIARCLLRSDRGQRRLFESCARRCPAPLEVSDACVMPFRVTRLDIFSAEVTACRLFGYDGEVRKAAKIKSNHFVYDLLRNPLQSDV